jgi:glycine cleavage system H protein
VNQDPYGGGWMIVVAPADPKEWDQLLTAAQYEQFVAEGGH